MHATRSLALSLSSTAPLSLARSMTILFSFTLRSFAVAVVEFEMSGEKEIK